MKVMDNVILDFQDEIAIISINRPKYLNALNREVLKELEEAVSSANSRDIRCLIIQGLGGKAFAAGADISAMMYFSKEQAKEFSEYGNKVFSQISDAPFPTIAQIDGYALGGGCELALSCDLRYCSDKSVFGQPEVGLGITPGFGGTQRLSRTVGLARAKELIFSGKTIDAKEAVRIGLVNQSFPVEELRENVLGIATTIVNNAPIAIKQAKRAICDGYYLSMSDALEVEYESFAECFATKDQIEGMSAFIGKRKHNKFINQ